MLLIRHWRPCGKPNQARKRGLISSNGLPNARLPLSMIIRNGERNMAGNNWNKGSRTYKKSSLPKKGSANVKYADKGAAKNSGRHPGFKKK